MLRELPEEIKEIVRDRDVNTMEAQVMYKNWKGDIGIRSILPLRILYGKTDYYPREQWLLKVWDFDKDDYRTYALKNIMEWI